MFALFTTFADWVTYSLLGLVLGTRLSGGQTLLYRLCDGFRLWRGDAFCSCSSIPVFWGLSPQAFHWGSP